MNVTVKTFAGYRELLGKELELSVPEGGTVRELLQILGKIHPAFLPEILERDGQLRPYVNILENGRNIRFLSDLETRLMEGDVISVFPPIAGG